MSKESWICQEWRRWSCSCVCVGGGDAQLRGLQPAAEGQKALRAMRVFKA